MSRLRPSVLAPLLVLAASICVAACGGGSSDDKTPNTPPDSTPAAGTTRASGATTGATSSAGGDSVDPELRAIGEKFARSTFKATYRTSESDSDGLGDLTLEKDGDAKFRFEITTNQDGEEVSSVFIETPDVSAFCLKQAGELGALVGVDLDEGVCFNNPADDATSEGGGLRDLFASARNPNARLLEKSKRTIAGQDGTCYRTQDNDDGVISTVCFTGDGVLLYIMDEGDPGSEVEARTVSSSVSDSDFELPYELKVFPGADLGE